LYRIVSYRINLPYLRFSGPADRYLQTIILLYLILPCDCM